MRLTVIAAFLVTGCQRPPLPSDVYVWNRSWSAAVQRSVRELEPEVHGLRVLLEELGPSAAAVEVDVPALLAAKRPVIGVLRASAEMPTGVDVLHLVERAEQLRARGIPIEQIELDYDSPTESLPRWVARLREFEHPGFRLSVTALPTWLSNPDAAKRLSTVVDEVVLQVHTIRAPVLFDAAQAVTDAKRWAQVTGRPFQVALPAYRATLSDGRTVVAEPHDVASVTRSLERVSLVRGFVFFRLGNADDRSAWSPSTLAAVLRRQPLTAARVMVVLKGDPVHDVWLTNSGALDAMAPSAFEVLGSVAHSEATTGYERLVDQRGAHFASAHPLWLRPGERIRVGTLRGEHLHVAVP